MTIKLNQKHIGSTIKQGMWVAGGKLISNHEPHLSFIFSFKLIPIEFDLYQNYPNPFNPSTRISYSPPYASFVSIKVYDVLGKEIAMLVNEKKLPALMLLNLMQPVSQVASISFYCNPVHLLQQRKWFYSRRNKQIT